MTISEAQSILHCPDTVGGIYSEKYGEALSMAMEALKREPCEDAISRQAVLDALDKGKYSNTFCEEHNIDWSINLGMAHIVVNELKPVTTQPKMGHWEWVQYDYNPKLGNWHCSECRCVAVECVGKEEKGGIPLYRYCPQCGAKMVEPQENGKSTEIRL